MFTRLIVLLLLWSSFNSQAQTTTTVVSYDFNSGTSFSSISPTVATDVTSSVSSTEPFVTFTGTTTGSSAFTAGTAGLALGMNNSAGTNTRYLEFVLGGANLPSYFGYKLYYQQYHPSTGASTITVAFSGDGGRTFETATPITTGSGIWTEHLIDLSSQSSLHNKAAVVVRLLVSGASGVGPVRIDNFQVQATSLLNPKPTLTALAPSSIAAGSGGFTLAVTGSGFGAGSVVRFNGTELITTVVSATQLSASVPASAVAAAGSFPVTVFNPAPGGGSSESRTFTVTPVVRWDGGAGTSSWFDAQNWDKDALPTSNDDVLLDHTSVVKSYAVVLAPGIAASAVGTPAVTVRSLRVNPGAGDSIFFEIPALNTSTTPLTLTRSGATEVALAIHDKGVVTNSSDQGVITIESTSQVFYIYNGGTYRHYTDRPHAALVQTLATTVGTEAGTWEFRAKNQASATPSLAGRTYPNLVFRNRPGQPYTSYGGSGANPLTIRGNLIVGSAVTFAPDLNSELRVAGDIIVRGNFRFQPSQTTAAKLVLNGSKPQRISGTAWGSPTSSSYLGPSVPLQINNTSTDGVTLATPVTVNNILQLTSGRLNTDATALLTLLNQPTGGSDNSFVSGPVARQTSGAASLTFPLGRLDAQGHTFRPLTLNISSLSRATTFVATQTEGGFAAQPLGAGLKRINSTRYFTITAEPALTGSENFAATVTLSFGPDDKVTNPEASTLVVARYNGTEWISGGRSSYTSATTTDAYVSGTLTSAPVSALGAFTLGSTDISGSQNPLPVTLLGFRAERQNEGVRLHWTTATELANAYFQVQRSTDGQHFATLTTLAGQGTSQTAHTYAWYDGLVPSGALYYRLRQVDADGTSNFSSVVVLRAAPEAITVYPNPVQGQLAFQTSVANVPYRVVNLFGQTLLDGKTSAGANTVEVHHLPAGAYYLLVHGAGKPERSKFYKQ
ncbi:T9SS type A sorting domain-containing protein [Hymenobacter tenuis]